MPDPSQLNWGCAACDATIKTVGDGWIEWTQNEVTAYHSQDFRVVHHRPSSPVGGCYSKHRNYGLHLRDVLGHSGRETLTELCDNHSRSPAYWTIDGELFNKLAKYSPTNRSKFDRPKSFTSIRFEVLRRDNYKCRLCGRNAKDDVKLEVDHIHPRSKGGDDTLTNLWTLCFDCNRGKFTKPL